MYKLKTGTVNDVEDIRQIIEMTWLDLHSIETERAALVSMLDITHSAEKIKFEILNYYQHYVLVVEDDRSVAFAAYSVAGLHPPDFKIHKIYHLPALLIRDYNKILIKHIEELAYQRGSKHLTVHIPENVNKAYFEALGFLVHSKAGSAYNSIQKGFEMIKNL